MFHSLFAKAALAALAFAAYKSLRRKRHADLERLPGDAHALQTWEGEGGNPALESSSSAPPPGADYAPPGR